MMMKLNCQRVIYWPAVHRPGVVDAPDVEMTLILDGILDRLLTTAGMCVRYRHVIGKRLL